MGRLFGTDGVRGIANGTLTCELAMNIGRAAACVLTGNIEHRPKFIIGSDTRISSDMLISAICAGVTSVGADAVVLGVVPTPAVAYLVGKYNADAGIMISASHNPASFNGIKIFSSDGFKLPDEIWLEPEIIDLALGTSQSVEVLFDEAGSEIRGVYWAAETEGIVSFKEYTSGTKNYLKANAVGLTLIMAILDNETYALCLVNVYDPNARIPGDADDNRLVNIYDALTILKHLSGETVDINLSNAEVTGDGQLSVQDAMLIMKKGAGWNVTLK